MDTQELSRRADANYVAFWSLYASCHDEGEVRAKHGIVCVDSGTRIAMLNNAFVTRPLMHPEEQLADAVRFFDERDRPFCVRITEGLDPDAERACESLGLPYSDTVPGMALEHMRGGGRQAEALEIRIAHDERTFDEHVTLVAEQFGFPLEIARKLYPPRMLELDDAEFYVGYVDGQPVAASALYAYQRVAGIYNVATRPEYRRRGIGEAMTWQCVQRGAAMGCIMAALQASDMGRPVYERMGFRLVSPYRTFHRPGV